jgi:hypothetical protein
MGKKLKLKDVKKLGPQYHHDIKKMDIDSRLLKELRAVYRRGYLGISREPLLAGIFTVAELTNLQVI